MLAFSSMISDNGDESGAGSFPQQLSQIRVNISASFASLKSTFASPFSVSEPKNTPQKNQLVINKADRKNITVVGTME